MDEPKALGNNARLKRAAAAGRTENHDTRGSLGTLDLHFDHPGEVAKDVLLRSVSRNVVKEALESLLDALNVEVILLYAVCSDAVELRSVKRAVVRDEFIPGGVSSRAYFIFVWETTALTSSRMNLSGMIPSFYSDLACTRVRGKPSMIQF